MPATKPFNTNRAIAILLAAIIVSGWLWGRSYFASVSVSDKGALIIPRRDFTFFTLFYLLLFAAEIFIYRWLRRKHIVKLYANIHILSVLVAKIFVPLLYMSFLKLAVYYFNYSDLYSILLSVVRPLQMAATFFLIGGHVFFIMAIIKRNDYPQQEAATDGSGDVLNEFAE